MACFMASDILTKILSGGKLYGYQGENIPGIGNSQCKDPKVE